MMVLGVVASGEGWAQQKARQQPAAAVDMDASNGMLMPGRRRVSGQSYQGDQFKAGLCSGIGRATANNFSCFPVGVTFGQMVRVVVTYIDARPARLHESFLVLAREALQEAWPCQR